MIEKPVSHIGARAVIRGKHLLHSTFQRSDKSTEFGHFRRRHLGKLQGKAIQRQNPPPTFYKKLYGSTST